MSVKSRKKLPIVYYGDGAAQEADGSQPSRGVQVIVQSHPDTGSEIVTSSDYYVLDGDRWRGVDIFGLFDFLMDSGIVLFGRTIGRDEYQEIVRTAIARKETWLPAERKP
jgi:hypothetical protein